MPSMSINPRVRRLAFMCMVGGVGFFVLAIAPLAVPALAPGAPPVPWLHVFLAAFHVCQIAGIAAIGLTGAVGRAGAAGLWLAAAGAATFAVAELMMFAGGPASETAFGLGLLLTITGLAMAGGSVLRQRRWSGPGRFLPLSLGAYNVLLTLALAAGQAQLSQVVFAINAALWILLGWSLYGTRLPVRLHTTPA